MGRDAADVAHGAVLRATQHSRAQRVSGHPGGHPGPYTPAVTEPTSLTRPRRRCYSGLSSHGSAARWPQVSLGAGWWRLRAHSLRAPQAPGVTANGSPSARGNGCGKGGWRRPGPHRRSIGGCAWRTSAGSRGPLPRPAAGRLPLPPPRRTARCHWPHGRSAALSRPYA